MSIITAPMSHNPSAAYPEPLIVPPSQDHKHTFIILHGRGSTASKFAPEILSTPLSDPQALSSSTPGPQTLATAFPNAKFVFPTASRRRAVIYKRMLTHQWFDNWHLHEPDEREELQIDGLRESSTYIHGLLREEIEAVGARNVVLWGLSQGCAVGLVAMLTWEGEVFGGVVGMCGWLPFRKGLEEAFGDGEGLEGRGEGEEDIFEDREEMGSEVEPAARAVAWLRDQLDMAREPISKAFQRIPVFMGHGTEDDKVFINLGREAVECLKMLGVDIRWKEYKGLGHWYSNDMLNDTREFVGEPR